VRFPDTYETSGSGVLAWVQHRGTNGIRIDERDGITIAVMALLRSGIPLAPCPWRPAMSPRGGHH
jgi:hypothetical protein